MLPHDARLAKPAAGFRSSIGARRRSHSVVESPPRHAQETVFQSSATHWPLMGLEWLALRTNRENQNQNQRTNRFGTRVVALGVENVVFPTIRGWWNEPPVAGATSLSAAIGVAL